MAPLSSLANISSEKLPTDLDRNPTVQDYEVGYVDGSKEVSFESVEGAEGADKKVDAALLALFGILIKRYVREPEIEVGLVTSKSKSTAIPLHGVMSGEGSISSAIGQVSTLLTNAKDLASLPDDTDLSAAAFHVAAAEELPRDWAHISYVNIDARKVDLCLLVKPKDKNVLKFSLRYNAKLFSKFMITAMMRSWETLITNALGDLSLGLNTVSVVSEEDAKMLIHTWNQTEATFTTKKGIHELFEANADKSPTHLAIVGPSHDKADEKTYELTYGEVERRANQLAHYLANHAGVKAGSIVGVLLERSTTFYVAMLAILKAGGAYVSIDPEYPDDRIEYMLQDSAAPALITTHKLGSRLSPLPGLSFVHIDDDSEVAAIASEPATRPTTVALDPELLCYVIYTSGSTGKPKGVQLTHANVLNLVRAEEMIYQVKPDDRVLQGFSTSFDASVEEIWMALHNGATLVVGTKEIMRSGPDFPRILEQFGVTCLSTVPTLLSTVEEDFKNVRIIITGGEACSKELVNRWAVTPGRRFFNTYGPTEATVIATYKECMPGNERMSIGKPLPNYQCYILDDNMQLLPPGAIGELIIGGVSVSRNGYLNLPEKTASVFKPDTLTNSRFPLYKSGDLARFSPAGNIEYYGRADSQVKIRGYRVELSEIESVMCEYPGIKSAVVDVQAAGGVKHLVGFVIPSGDDASLDTGKMLASMKEKLPIFMIPSHVEKVSEFPTLPSGKVERRRLPRVMEKLAAAKASQSGSGPSEAVLKMKHFEKKVAMSFDTILGAGSVESTTSNFFTMGGNSLMVSRLITELRKEYPTVTSRDVYSNPTVEGLAAVLEKMAPAKVEEREIYIPSRRDTLIADVVQTLSMYPIAAYMGLNSITIWILFFTFKTWPAQYLIPFLAAVSLFITFGAFFIVSAAKWLILGEVKEGDYPLWGSYHLRFWFVQSLDDLFRSYYSWLLAGTPVVNLYYRLLGSKVGRHSFIAGTLEGFELIEIGDEVTLNLETVVSGITVEDNMLKLRKVKIGNGTTVGVRSAIQPNAIVGSNVKIDAMSLVNSGSFIPAGQMWGGSPATKMGPTPTPTTRMKGVGPLVGFLQLFWVIFWKASTAVYLLPFLYIIRKVEVLNIYDMLYGASPEPDWEHVPINLIRMIGLFMVLQVGLFFISTVWVKALKALMLIGMNDVKSYPLASMYYFRRWAADNMMNSLGGYTKQLRGSIYLPHWYRFMGATMGTHAEISSYVNICAEKLTLGDHVFVADDVIVGPLHLEDGMVYHDKVSIGNRAFVGNASVVRDGTIIPAETLVGVQTLAPKNAEPKGTYVGSPPFKIKREGAAVGNDSKAEAVTYNPPLHMLIGRYIVEALGFLLLHFCLALSFSILYICITFSYNYLHDGIYAAVLPCFVIAYAIICGAISIFFKWLIIGRFKPGTYPLYGTYVWRTELTERLEENVAQLALHPLITGTVYMQLFYQAMGTKIGKRAFLDHPCFCEPDLITIGDYVNIERTGTLQAHLFQDRVRTTGPIRIGHFCSVGSSAVVLIGGAMGDKASLSALSMVMRSEELPPNSKWHGLPAKPHNEVDLEEARASAQAADEEEGRRVGATEVIVASTQGGGEEMKEDVAASSSSSDKAGGKKKTTTTKKAGITTKAGAAAPAAGTSPKSSSSSSSKFEIKVVGDGGVVKEVGGGTTSAAGGRAPVQGS